MSAGLVEHRSAHRAGQRLAVALLGCAAALALWAPAAPAVTIGPPIENLPANTNLDCDDQNVILWVLPPAPPSCSLLGNDPAGAWTSQVPRGEWVIRTARVRTGPRVGPMVFTVIRAMRSQAGAGGIICCSTPVESQVFTPAPNSVNAIPVNLPVKNTVDVIDGEPIETVDYLGISLLVAGTTSLPMHVPAGGFGSGSLTSYIAPAIRAGQERLSDGTVPFNNVLLVNGEADPASAGGGGGGGAGGGALAVTGFDLARATFRAAGRGGSVRAAAKVGTRVSYALSAAGRVAFAVERRGAGRKVRGKCRKRTRANAGRKRCDLRLKGSFKHNGVAGPNSFTFTGRLKGRKLEPGRYNLVAKPSGAGAKATRAKFRIVAR
jgi:hypothetical protein